LKVYQVLVGFVGRVQTVVLYATDFVVGECQDQPFPLKVTVELIASQLVVPLFQA